MPSERRLHPISILFDFGAQLRSIALPGLFVLFTAGTAGYPWEIWMLPLLIPYALVSIVRYASYRYRYDASEMVIRTGLVFRNERHVPYARIQNIDAVQNVLHRLMSVVEVRVETGAGQEPEARLSVLPVAALEEMRQRVFGAKASAAAETDAPASPSVPPEATTLLTLTPRELMLYGLIEGRGTVVVTAAFGVLWQLGLWDRLGSAIFSEDVSGRGMARDVARAVFGDGGVSAGRILLTLAAVGALLVALRFISMGWAVVRLHGYRLTRAGEDLRTEFGLLTRVTATIPLRRIQTLSVREGPLHRLAGRVSVRVDTAGADQKDGSKTQREWLAPIIRRQELPALLGEVLPEIDLDAVDWVGAHPRAFRRKLNRSAAVATIAAVSVAPLVKGWGVALLGVFLVLALVHARLYVAHLWWGVTDEAVLFRSGWVWQHLSVARFTKIQAVALHESPFDRRSAMARVRVDTAGAGDASHRIDIPYLSRETANSLCDLLATQADRTTFRW